MDADFNIKTERLVLRPWRDGDRESFAALNADPRVMEFFPSTLDREKSDELLAKIEAHLEREGFGPLALEAGAGEDLAGQCLGFTGLMKPGFEADFIREMRDARIPCVEIGWRLRAEAWGYGYASEGARAALGWGFDRLGLPEIVSFTAVSNKRSIAVMERIGMIFDREFDHPAIKAGDPLCRHVLYRLKKSDFKLP